MARRIIIPDPTLKYWRVKLTETIGLLTVEGWIRHIWAKSKEEAATKALLFHMRKNPGSRPHLQAVELEPYSHPIQI